MTRPPKRILLVSANGLGDCVAFLPVAAAVRRRWPESRVAMMTRRAGAEATQLTETVDQFILMPDRRAAGRFGRAREFFQRVRALRKDPFDLALMASGEGSATAALLFLGGVGTRIGFDDCRLRWLLSTRVVAREPELESRRNFRFISDSGKVPGSSYAGYPSCGSWPQI